MDESVNKNGSHDDEVQFMDYLVVIAKHSRMIIWSGVIVTVLTYLILFIMPNEFTSETRLMPPQQSMTLSGQILASLDIGPIAAAGGGGLGGMAASMLGIKTPADLYVGILKGNTIFDRIIKRFNLRKHYSSGFSTKPIEEIRKKLSKRADITAGKDGLIDIQVTDENPRRAAAMANAFPEELDSLLQRMARKEAKNYLTFLQKERDRSSKNLARAENSLRNFSEQTNVLQMNAQTRGVLEYIAKLRATIDAKEVQLSVLRQQATPSNYDVIQLKTEIKGLEGKLRKAEIQNNQNCDGDTCIPTSKLPTLGMKYFRLVREAKYQQIIYQMYCKLVELARMDAVRKIPVVQVVDRAVPAEKKSNMRLLPSILAGFCTSFLAIFWAFVLEWKQRIGQSEGGNKRLALLHDSIEPYKRALSKVKKLLSFRKP